MEAALPRHGPCCRGMMLQWQEQVSLWLGYIYSCREEKKRYSQQNLLLEVALAILNGKPNRLEHIPGIFLGR